MQVRAVTPTDRRWLRARIAAAWGMPVVTPVATYDRPDELDGLVAEDEGARVGAVTWSIRDREWEVVTLEALRPREGIGRSLMGAVRARAASAGATRVWLITTTDNPTGVEFYAAIGMRTVRVHEEFSARVAGFKPSAGGNGYDAVEYEWIIDTE